MSTVTTITIPDGANKVEIGQVEIYHLTNDMPEWRPQLGAVRPNETSFHTALEKTLVVSGGFFVTNEDVGTHFFGPGWVSDIRSPKPYKIKTKGTTEWWCVSPMDKVYGNVHGKQGDWVQGDVITLSDAQQLIVLEGTVEVGGTNSVAPTSVEGPATVTCVTDCSCVLVTRNT